MEYRSLGKSGLQVSRLCLGTMTYGSKSWRPWILEEADARPFFRRAWEHGINFFDTADMYSDGESERITGRALQELGPRDQQVVATKVYFPTGSGPNNRGLSRKHIFDAIDASLRRLAMDYVDLYVIHRWDRQTPIEETLRALNDVVQSGKARYLGASSMWAWQFGRAQDLAGQNGWMGFVSMQNHYNLIYREEEREMIPLCLDLGVGLTPWSPLARGFLAGNRGRDQATGKKGGETSRALHDGYAHGLYYAESDFRVVDRLVEVSRARGEQPVQVALAWLLGKPGVVSPIVGATSLEQLDALVAATSINLDERETSLLEESYLPHRVLGHD